ncbi:hypothetical protein LX64_01962 [Chitinophaga skermanii]|uniref:Uncharacterized protein n=1 Tax=Chitinophaga skermanii TaxID=331697 RepID=A0A327QSG4_9BACT|nr:hypothetical protein [Chitinophaga skermanii]RAJ06835.1 hypothetical protein LX64_01962 [Chitinophaga skermanii]
MKKSLVRTILTVVVIAIIAAITFDYPLIIVRSKVNNATPHFQQDALFKPLDALNFKQGEYTAYLLIHRTDLTHLPNDMKRHLILRSKDATTLQTLQSNFHFKRMGGSITTCKSDLLLFKNGTLIYRTKIGLEPGVIGIEEAETGFLKSMDHAALAQVFKSFQPVYTPILVL